jgi:transcriptional regulator with XRE-family HTH domain
MVHVGKLIEEQLQASGMTQSELGRRVNRSKQAIQHILKNPHISTDLLKDIGEALDYDFFAHFTKGTAPVEEKRPAASPSVSITLNIPGENLQNVLISAFGDINGRILASGLIPGNPKSNPALS